MAGLGLACLLLALAVCAYGIGASLYGVRSGRAEFSDSGRRSVYALAGILTVAFVVLEVAFLRNDFAFNTVADTSSRTTPRFYRAAAVWSSQEGSLLLWAWLLSMWSSLALFLTRKRMRDVAAYATAILLGFGGFFISLMVFYANPFATTHPAPAEGVGLDPLLRFPTMMIHPPMLYSGYTLCTIPLAFGMGALLARRVDADWIRAIRRFAFAAWLFLGIGILLGARWSYSELGWGGYWGWDAVENASLMPWLTGTAFLHSLMIQEKRGMLKVWNVSLVLATGTLAIMGTFLVRSGVLNSIHAFGGATLGVPFVVLIAVLIAGSIYLVVSRREMLRSEHRLDSLLSRESIFLANNLVLVGALLRDLLGHLLPADLRGADRPGSLRRAAVVRPLHGAARAGARAAQRDRAGDRVAARDARQRAAQLPRAARSRRSPRCWRCSPPASRDKPLAIAMFCCAGVRVRQHRPGVLPRRARAPRDGRRGGRRSRCSRSCGATAGATAATSCTSGSRCCSSASPRPRPSSTPPSWASRRASRTRVGAYTVRYVRPTATITPRYDAAHTGSTLGLGAVLDVTTRRAPRGHAQPERGLLRLSGSRPGHGRQPDRRAAGQPRQHERRRHARHLERDRSPTSKRRRCKRIVKVGNAHADRPKRRSSRSAISPAPTSSTRRRRSFTSSSRRW